MLSHILWMFFGIACFVVAWMCYEVFRFWLTDQEVKKAIKEGEVLSPYSDE